MITSGYGIVFNKPQPPKKYRIWVNLFAVVVVLIGLPIMIVMELTRART